MWDHLKLGILKTNSSVQFHHHFSNTSRVRESTSGDLYIEPIHEIGTEDFRDEFGSEGSVSGQRDRRFENVSADETFAVSDDAR